MMDAQEEYILRVAERQRRERGLSKAAYAELLIAVRHDPDHFVDSPEDEAMALLAQALGRYEESLRWDESLDDDEYLRVRSKRLLALRADCQRIASLDERCTDARLCGVIAQESNPDDCLPQLLEIERDAANNPDALAAGDGPDSVATAGDLWNGVFSRPLLRAKAAVCRTYFDSARYRLSIAKADEAMGLSPLDVLGTRHTAMLAHARLEDEAGFEALDARLGRRGDAWQGLARVIMLYKLGRVGAARRALRGFDQLCDGGMYALLRPVYVEPYLPDRPIAAPYSFDEATLAVHEADTIIMDVPDLPAWVESQDDMTASAADFARRSGLEF